MHTFMYICEKINKAEISARGCFIPKGTKWTVKALFSCEWRGTDTFVYTLYIYTLKSVQSKWNIF